MAFYVYNERVFVFVCVSVFVCRQSSVPGCAGSRSSNKISNEYHTHVHILAYIHGIWYTYTYIQQMYLLGRNLRETSVFNMIRRPFVPFLLVMFVNTSARKRKSDTDTHNTTAHEKETKNNSQTNAKH